MKLYYHKTSGGAEYLFDTFIKCKGGHREGVINDKTKYVVRIDGDIRKDAELTVRTPEPGGVERERATFVPDPVGTVRGPACTHRTEGTIQFMVQTEGGWVVFARSVSSPNAAREAEKAARKFAASLVHKAA